MRSDQVLAVATVLVFTIGMVSLHVIKEPVKGVETTTHTSPKKEVKITKVTVTIRPGSYIEGRHPTYDPPSVRVTLGVNNTVVWINREEVDVRHDVTHEPCFRHEPDCIPAFRSALFAPGESFQYTFVDRGEYRYVCAAHPWMRGEVIVKG
ncbi:MAG: plastocyanin/azurin family copper-binding protein [Thaumarchaeota archaeon]|nr:plastocyanin/azurin family copper-binding protein [Candidatus Calditenuaceae archaeon]MDW8041553.1 plastocyanin/azurin family copper-binding protein [Nitrososphaerota archaeon]